MWKYLKMQFRCVRAIACFVSTLLIGGSCATAIGSDGNSRPNILIITVDDMGFNTPGVYGGFPADVTPNIDRLAAEGMRFNHAYVALAICQASRQSMMTGRYPHNAGFRWFEPVADGVPILSEILSRHGYLNACVGKAEHYQPSPAYRWSRSYDIVEMKGGRNPDEYYYYCRKFIEKATSQGAPFFLKANTHDPHRPFHGASDEEMLEHYRHLQPRMESIGGRFAEPSKTFGIDDLGPDPLGYLPPVPEVLLQTAQYLSSSRRADDSVGAILRAIRDTGQEENTIVVFLSDNGMPFPFAKAHTYVNGIRTPFIVRWPGAVKPGTVDDTTFVSTNDLMPTLLDILGIPAEGAMDGRSIQPALKGNPLTDRNSMVGVFYNIYPVAVQRSPGDTQEFQTRSLIKDGYIYIYNHWSGGEQRWTAKGIPRILESMREHGYGVRVDFFHFRTTEELYHIGNDLHALENLVDEPARAPVLQRMRHSMAEWMRDFKDNDLKEPYRRFLEGVQP